MEERTIKKIDATGKSLGRVATEAAKYLQGKHRADWLPHLDQGAVVEISNLKDAKFTGKKLEQKMYHRYTGYPGGLRSVVLEELWGKRPEEVMRRMVSQMLPKNKLSRGQMARLRIVTR
ncbi:MAG: 50S ribosomal protein L13 [Patescibacteria group bacterium]